MFYTHRVACLYGGPLLVGLLFWCWPSAAAQTKTPSFADKVPADVGLFVELHRAGDLLIPLTDSQLWVTVAELAGRPADAEEAQDWRQRVQQTLGMSPVEAIGTLFSRQVAYICESPRGAQDAVVMCEPVRPARTLLNEWPGHRLPTTGRTSVYRLPNNVGVGLHQDALIFGDVVGKTLFSRVLRALEARGAKTLAADPTYKRLLARVPPGPTGIVFARLQPARPPTTPATQRADADRAGATVSGPMANLSSLLYGSRSVLLALHREDGLLHFTLAGDATGARTGDRAAGALAELVNHLPERTLMAWAGRVDHAALTGAVRRLPGQHALRIAYEMHERAGTVQRLMEALGTRACVALGVVWPEGRTVAAPPIPAAALLISTRDALAAEGELSALLEHSVALYKLLSLRLRTAPVYVPQAVRDVAGVPAQEFDLSNALGPRPERSLLGELHLSWALDGEVLILATHTDWLQQILVARHGERQSGLEQVLRLSRGIESKQHDALIVAQLGPMADLGQLWLNHFEEALPAILNERWWRSRQPGGPNVRLGVQVVQDADRRRLRVTSVTPGTPADGVLKVGDEILGCHPLRFRTQRPVLEIQREIVTRPNARWIDLIIERDRVVRVRRVPLPFVDPIQVLRRMAAVGHVVQRVVYCDEHGDAGGPRGHLTVELRRQRQPLFDFREPRTPDE